MPSNFEFNKIRKNLNISEWNCEYTPVKCVDGVFELSKSCLFDSIAK